MPRQQVDLPIRRPFIMMLVYATSMVALNERTSAQNNLPSTLAWPIRSSQRIAENPSATPQEPSRVVPGAANGGKAIWLSDADTSSKAPSSQGQDWQVRDRQLRDRQLRDRQLRSVQTMGSVPALGSHAYAHDGCPGSVACALPAGGLSGPWPPDEYLCDGGDANVRVVVGTDERISGLDLEDTVIHFKSEDGRRFVTPTNRVCIYAPRFAAVRKVINTKADERLLYVAEADQPQPVWIGENRQPPVMLDQPEQANRLLDIDGAVALRDRTRGVELANGQKAVEFVSELETHEDLQIMRFGVAKRSQKAQLIEYMTAALTWSDADSPEVLFDLDRAVVDSTDQRAGVVYQSQMGPPRLRIIKLASTNAARPGEEVEFTLRFDNVGDQTIDKVTVIDNLTTRLEYVPDSSQSNRQVVFSSELNEGESLVLRWDLQEPLRPGDGGIIRFRCKVR